MPNHRVILANQPRLLREMLRRVISKAPDIHVIGETGDSATLCHLIAHRDAHWVVLSLNPDGGIPALANTLLAENPGIKVIAVAADGSLVKVYWTEAQERHFADLSLTGFLGVMRDREIHSHSGKGEGKSYV